MTSEDAVGTLIQYRRFAEALRLLEQEELETAGIQHLARRRHCLARLGRLREAAGVGRRAAAHTEGRPTDLVRLARILLDLGEVGQAADASARAAVAAQVGERLQAVALMVECVLRAPDCWERVAAPLAAIGGVVDGGGRRPARRVREPTLHVPLLLPPYRHLDYDHPAHMRLIERVSGVAVDRPRAEEWEGLAGFADALEVARREFVRLALGRGPLVRARAARFVAGRFGALLHPAPQGALRFVMGEPLTIGDGSWVYWFDQMVLAFQPSQMFERTAVSAHRTAEWHFLRTLLGDRRCRAVFSHFRRTPEDMGRFLRLPDLASKGHHIRPYETTPVPAGDDGRASDGPLRILFPGSRTSRFETFFYRGGVDALAAFRRYRQMGGEGELILRCPLPEAVAGGGRAQDGVRIIENELLADQFIALRRSCHLALLPATFVYRGSLVECMATGLVPLAYHTSGIAEFIDDGRTGVLVRRRPDPYALDAVGARFAFDATPLFAASPADPSACEELARTLLALDRDRHRLAAMSVAAQAAARSLMHSAADQDLFDTVITTQAEAALREDRAG